MTDTIQTHFSFNAAPFTKEVTDTDLWLPPSRLSAIDELVECLESRSSALVTGESGVGKTCILRAVRQRLPKERFRLTYCPNSTTASPRPCTSPCSRGCTLACRSRR